MVESIMKICLMKNIKQCVNMKIIVGLPIEIDGIDHNKMSDREKYEYAMKRENRDCQVYHSTTTFLNTLNADKVDTENMLYYEVEVSLP